LCVTGVKWGGNSKIPIKIHTCAKLYADGFNKTGKMVKKTKLKKTTRVNSELK